MQTLEEVERFAPRDANKLAYVTQTTLSVDDTAGIVDLLKRRFPHIVGPHKEDICYATTNRQDAVKRVAPLVDAMIVVGAPNSSNSQRLKEVAERAGCPRAVLVQRAAEIDWSDLTASTRLGITAGASAPEVLVEEIIDAFADRYTLDVETVTATEEGRVLPAAAPAAGPRGGGVTLHGRLHRRLGGRLTRFSPATTSANCCPTRASPKAWRTPIFWSTPVPAITSSRSTRSAWRPATCRFFLGLMEHLAARGITCPQPVKNRQGEMLGKIAGRPAAIVTFLDGMWIRRPSPGHCAAVGEALARLHLAGADFKQKRANALSVEGWRPLYEQAKAGADSVRQGLCSEIATELDALEKSWPRDLPQGVIHADLFPTTCSSLATSCPA